MIKILQKYAISVALLAASFAAKGQTPVVDENFQSWQYFGFTADPGTTANSCPGGVATTGPCESASLTPASTTVTKTYPTGTVIYSLTECGVAPACPIKSGCSTACPTITGADVPGYVIVGKTPTAAFTTSEFANITTIDLILSWSGANRNFVIQKSTNGGTSWDNVGTAPFLGGTCSQYGVDTAGIVINSSNVMLRFIADNITPNLQYSRIHSLKIYGTIAAATSGVQNASWTESGLAVSLVDKDLTLTSNNIAGSIDIVSLTGAATAQKEIQKGGQAYFVMPASGLYIVRFTSGNKIYTKKISVN
jgi:hypothetical protein